MVLQGDHAEISGTTITDNSAMNGGGMVLSNCKNVEVRNVTLVNNKATQDAGAIYSDSVLEFSVMDTVMTGNTASQEGGAISIIGNNKATISNSILDKNEADKSGGGFICEAKSTVQVNASTFSYNYAKNGQSIAAECSCKVSVTGSTFNRDRKRKRNGDFFKSSKECATITHINSHFTGAPRRGLSVWWILFIVVLCLAILLSCFFCFAPRSWRLRLKIMILTRRLAKTATTLEVEQGSVPLIEDENEADGSDDNFVSHRISISGERVSEIKEAPVAGTSFGRVHSKDGDDDMYYSDESYSASLSSEEWSERERTRS